MLIKEYRIPLPMSVEEYRIAQLYMIQKKSRMESEGRDSGVEIIVNEPYSDGPGGSGQLTKKVYHIGRHLPGWLHKLLGRHSPEAHEEAWNAYPYTKTRYSTPLFSSFCIDIETVYHPDLGTQSNVFGLDDKEQKSREIVWIDIVKDTVSDYKASEDPKLFVSQKTGRGPLTDSWREDYARNPKKGPVMCAYKLCRVKFAYWGAETKTEKFICTEMGKMMVSAHRQAWCWQDEFHGLNIDDIRKLERETQLALARKMAPAAVSENENENDENVPPAGQIFAVGLPMPSAVGNNSPRNSLISHSTEHHPSSLQHPLPYSSGIPSLERSRSGSKQSFHSPNGSFATDVLEGLRTDLEDGGSDDEFFDASEWIEPELVRETPLVKWSSLELVEEDDQPRPLTKDDSIFSSTFKSDRMRLVLTQAPRLPTDATADDDICPTSVLVLVFHGGSILDTTNTIDLNGNRADISTFSSCFDTVLNDHYPSLLGHVVVKGVRCPPICAEALTVLSSLTPYSFDVMSSTETTQLSQDHNHLSALSLFATSSPAYRETVTKCIKKANQVYHDFLQSVEGKGYKGPVCLVGDSTASMIVYDALCRYGASEGSSSSISSERNDLYPTSPLATSVISNVTVTAGGNPDAATLVSVSGASVGGASTSVAAATRPSLRPTTYPASRSLSNPGSMVAHLPNSIPAFAPLSESGRYLSAPVVDKLTGKQAGGGGDNGDVTLRYDFDVGDVFVCGAPLGLVLAYRKFTENIDERYGPPLRPWCSQFFNLFHATDPSATRIEPLLSAKFSFLKPVPVPWYQRFPLGDGRSYFLYEHIQQNRPLFEDTSNSPKELNHHGSEFTFQQDPALNINTISNISRHWWGNKRIDYALYCPDGATSLPTSALPHLFHASFWESLDVVSFMIRQIFQPDNSFPNDDNAFRLSFSSDRPTEKWLRRRTSIKLKNMHPNHRGNDVVVGENDAQTLSARFMYGPLDMLTLTGEKVDIYIMTQPPSGEWELFGTEITSSHGRVTFQVPEDKKLGLGMYPVKMVVRGDHTAVDFYLTVVPPQTESVVFSIDGSFTASVSVSGKDPKVRAGAVDIVRHWQELGYLIVYITGRPDMQHQPVVRWLAHHNFPHGMVSFCDGVVADPLRQKSNHLKSLADAGVTIHAAYGSSKDIQVYASVGLRPDEIFCIGKASKKLQDKATMLNDGYSAHLSELIAPGGSRPAQGNARMVIRRSFFNLPVPTAAPDLRRNRSINRGTRHGGPTAPSNPESPPPSTGSGSSPYTPRFSFRTPEPSPKDDKDSASLKGSIGGKRRGFFSRF
ncbi:Membrane-associated phosphatidylinositol transfer protein 1 [Hypsibius exemplaris]|uniref:Membrane-associated phosphatidylinositol transfer protein 1 n=1 Tax=Hypsibius exemplaris TaxID=2072580 RepID=A0A1W0XCM3_HYPEX|nr:Membrane-associated phosphatidylinositol transfer protein 1 [Hypsibius exemplaris]